MINKVAVPTEFLLWMKQRMLWYVFVTLIPVFFLISTVDFHEGTNFLYSATGH